MNRYTRYSRQPSWFVLRRAWRLGSITVAALMLALLLLTLLTAFGQSDVLLAQAGPQLTVDIGLEGNPPSLQPGEIFTQRVRLNYSGGAQVIETFFTQQIPASVRPITMPSISETVSQTITPLQIKRRGRTWGWQGKMRPDAELIVTFPLRVQQCYGDDQTLTLDVSARQPDGGDITNSVSVPIICSDQSIQDIEVTEEVIYAEDDEVLAAESTVLNKRFYVPGTKSTLRVTFLNNGTGPIILGTDGAAACCMCLTCTVAANVYAADLNMAADAAFRQFVLNPGETVAIDQPMTGAPTVTDPGEEGEYVYGGELTYCLSSSEDSACPDPAQNPQLAALHKLEIPVRPNDLGDAPDSTNHAAAAMSAYAGTPAQFPTVFDPATGAEQGPRHVYPQFFHLGPRVSLEAEADMGPDQDPTNNILPVPNSADNDRGDDGANPSTWTIQHCQKTEVPVRIFISPAAVNWFQQQGGKGYLNGWLDMNRNGNWQDAFTCQDANGQAQMSVEQLIMDHEIDVAALGAGLHTINVPTGIIVNNLAPVSDPAWVRLTLSERASNKPLTSGTIRHGDGRGYARPFRTGETEDYLIRPSGHAQAGPDVEVQVSGEATEHVADTLQGVHAAQANAGIVNFRVRFSVKYANRGTADAKGALLEFQIPEKLRSGELVLLRAPGIATDKITRLPDKIQFALPDLQAAGFGTISLGWVGCLTCTVAANVQTPLESYDASVNVTLADDVNPDNNQATARVSALTLGPLIGIKSKADNLLRHGGMTCQETVDLVGRAWPGTELIVEFQPLSPASHTAGAVNASALQAHALDPLTATVKVDIFGQWTLAQPLPNGRYNISARYRVGGLANVASAAAIDPKNQRSAVLNLRVDHSTLLDPMSFRMVNANGRSFAVQTTSKLGNFEIQDLMLPPGDYTAHALSCPNVVLDGVEFKVGDAIIDATQTQASADCEPKGSDACGPWSAKITVANLVAASAVDAAQSFEIVAMGAASENAFVGRVESGTGGVVSDVATAQPLANAVVTLLAGSDSLYEAWRGASYGQANPQTTGADGLISLAPPAGTYRVSVEANGYQPFLSADIVSDGGLLRTNIDLSLQIAAAADYTIQVTESGFQPALLTVPPGSIVEFVNMDLADHAISGTLWNSGILSGGASYKVRLDGEGVYPYGDAVQSIYAGTIIVAEAPVVEEGQKLFLPIAKR